MVQNQRKTLFLILIPMIATFVIQRFVLHHSPPDTHVFIGGYLVHHLFSGVLVLIPTAFLLAFGIHHPRRRSLALALLGFSSAMVLDEVIYLVCTDGSGVAYRGPVSLWGAVLLLGGASLFLLAVPWWRERKCQARPSPDEAIHDAPAREA